MDSYSLDIRQMRSKWEKKLQNAKWAGKSLSAENVWEWCPKQHIKTSAPLHGAFMEVLTP